MIKLVLVAPDRERYHAALFEFAALAKAQGAEPPKVLAPWEAAEWSLPEADAPFRAEILLAAEALRVDYAFVPDDESRRKRLLVCDMDSTIVECECLDELADFAGKGAEVAAITERAMAGELDFAAALEARVGMLAGLPAEAMARCYDERVTLTPGAKELVATMKASGARTALVTGGFDYFADRVAAEVGFDKVYANRLEIEAGALTGKTLAPIFGREGKRAALLSEVEALGVGPGDALAIGDGANDLAMIETAGLGVGFRPKSLLAARADARIEHADLAAALFFQGYRRAEFATIAAD